MTFDASPRRRMPRRSCCKKQRRVGDVSLRDTSRSIDHDVVVDRRCCGNVVVDMVLGKAWFTPPTHLSLNHLGSSSDACRWGEDRGEGRVDCDAPARCFTQPRDM